jgi:hypothetical protein
MKKLFLFLALLSASSALAQSAKVLVYSQDSTCYHLACLDSLTDAISKHYTGKIVSQAGSFPTTLDSFDAVFLIGLYNSDSAISRKLLTIRNYLNHGGFLYFESLQFYFSDTVFSNMIGVNSQANLDLASDITSVVGRDGYFTQGMNYTINRLLQKDHSDILKLTGPCEWVLTGTEAFQYQSGSYKVVFYRHLLDETYKDFIGHVICNYFGLCAPLSVKPSEENPQAEFSLFPNPARDVLHIWSNIDNPGLQSAELILESGTLVSKFSLGGNMNHIDLNLGSKNLSSGNYFLRLTTQKESFLKPVFLLKK